MVDDGVRAQAALHRYFGYESFRKGQKGVVSAIMEGRDSLAVMPTGAGKSVCYQIPSVLLPGLTIVISPLLSLMRDQVDALDDAGIAAAFLNSTQTFDEQREVMRVARDRECHLLYVAPERLTEPHFVETCRHLDISVIAVDEAHCISQWGQDFRPAYLDIGSFIAALPRRPVVAAFTATATEKVQDDIVRILQLSDPLLTVTGFDRPNLFLDVQRMSKSEKEAWILRYVSDHADESGIIYCSTRKETNELTDRLQSEGIRAARYHAGLTHQERRESQHAFVNDDIQVVVATNAFGMGIDKSNVRYVIHHNMPESIEAYYQEAGRAGRDGEMSRCTLLWNESDIVLRRRLLQSGGVNDHLTEEEEMRVQQTRGRLLQAMIGYCRTVSCLHRYILDYFGQRRAGSVQGERTSEEGPSSPASSGNESTSMQSEQSVSPLPCGRCSNCMSSVRSDDVTKIALAIGRCVSATNQRFGMTMIVRILRGSQSQQLLQLGLERTPLFAALKEQSEATVRDVLNQMTIDDLLAVTPGRMPIIVFGTEASRMVAPGFHYEIKHAVRRKSARKTLAPGAAIRDEQDRSGENPMDEDLFQRLRAVRKEIATEIGKPPYIVFSDRSLRDMVRHRPTDRDSMLQVNGVGEHKWDSYGQRFADAIAEFEAQ
ncbi:MAG: RecQ family ATP-dependent DNA helicase [Bifidobacterium sp.]|uniref:RecQ family ATP-dependent DNA helicase n=1 Tax=Bifidobacterium sp. TaxID=41200 RepID=UPI0039EAB2BF